ncbi:MAG: flagellar hook-length control protein FliK [Lachnospiraceae bacterium]|nr:flagellar hook-length control protein FliK [Lachnospiraceae bacterium]
MTSIPVGSAVGNAQMVSGKSTGLDVANQNKSGGFQETMDLLAKPEKQTPDLKQTPGDKQTTYQGKDLKGNDAGKKRIKNMEDQTVQSDEDITSEQMQTVQETGREIIEEIAEELDVTIEEVEAAMELLDLGVFDLAGSNQVSALMSEVLGLQDGMQIVTDGALFENFSALNDKLGEMFDTLSQELGVPVEELAPLLHQTDISGNEQELIPVFSDVLTEKADSNAFDQTEPVQEPAQEQLQVQMQMPDPEADDAKPVEDADETTSEHRQLQKPVRDDVSREVIPERHVEKGELKRENDSHDASDMGRETQIFQSSSQFEPDVATVEAKSEFAQRADINEIMRQIGDYVRTNVTPDVKQMEIQLTPANLGQVHINIMSRNGAVTAQIAAENEIVKQAIEVQAVQLKERLESQGVKIEAVEVTVASHEFERNLDENQQNRQNEENSKQSAPRRWNLTDPEGELDEDVLTEAEQVELDMMRLSGGNLNYMA